MASESTPMKKPDDEGAEKDDLFAEELDDIDLDALLEDDEEMDLLKDEPLALEEKADSAAAAPAPEEGLTIESPDLIDDEDIDLLADDDDDVSGGPSRASEGQEEGLGMGVGESETVRIDGSTNGRPPGSEPEDLLAVEEEPVFDLLAEDDDAIKEDPASREEVHVVEAEIDLLAEEPAESAAAAASEVEIEVEMSPEAADKESRAAQDTVALTPGAGKKPGRFAGAKGKFGKGKAPSKSAVKAAPAEEPEPAGAEAKPARRQLKEKVKKEKAVAVAAAVAPAAPRTTRSTVPFVCSECYEEFLIPANYSQEMVSCPECLHVGKRPDADFLRTIHVHKSGERKSFALAVGVGAVLLALLVGLVWMMSPYGTGSGGDGTMRMVLLGASALLAAVFVWLIVRFEGNRWEVYF